MDALAVFSLDYFPLITQFRFVLFSKGIKIIKTQVHKYAELMIRMARKIGEEEESIKNFHICESTLIPTSSSKT